jgi:hypothetical protein
MGGRRFEAVVEHEAGRLRLKTDYDEAFIASVKRLPPDARAWDPEAKIWYVDLDYRFELPRWGPCSAGRC